MRSPTRGCWRTKAHSRSSSGPALCRISSGTASLPRSWSCAARTSSSSSSRRSPSFNPVSTARDPTLSRCIGRSGSRSESASSSASIVRSVSIRLECFWAYSRSSATCSALLASTASSGSSTAPNELPISNPTPRSESAAHAWSISGSASPSTRGTTRQNSSPPKPVGAVLGGRHLRELRAEAGQQGVSGRVPERVVVPLEAVEVEDHQEGRLDLGLREESFEIGQELPAIAETRQRIGHRLEPRELEEAAILAERHREPDDDGEQRRCREGDGEQVDLVEVVVDEDADGEDGASGGDGEQRLASELGTAPVDRPGRRGDQEQCRRPEDVERRSLHVRVGGALEEVDRIGSGRSQDAQPEQEPAPSGSPAGEREDPEHGGEQKEIPERVGQIRDNRGGRALRRLENDLDEHRGGQRGRGERGRQAVEPQRPADRPRTRANQRHDPEVDEWIEAEVTDVRNRGVRLGMHADPPDLGKRPTQKRGGKGGPGRTLARDEQRP